MTEQDEEQWAERMLDGEEYDETLGEADSEADPVGVDDTEHVHASDAPEGFEDRDEDYGDDDPADVPDEHGGARWAIDSDDNGVDDTVLPEGTDSVVDERDDWQ